MTLFGQQFSSDLGGTWIALVALLVLGTLVLLGAEGRRKGRGPWAHIMTGALGALALAFAVLRPSLVRKGEQSAPARVVVLVDASERMNLPARGSVRRGDVQDRALEELARVFPSARLEVLAYGDHANLEELEVARKGPPQIGNELGPALEKIPRGESGPPGAIVVLTDGRVSRGSSLDRAGDFAAHWPEVPIHSVRVTDEPLRDRSIVAVRMPDVVVAHEPFHVDLDVGCSGGVPCQSVPFQVRELLQGAPPIELYQGQATPDPKAPSALKASFDITLDRSGPRIVEIALATDASDVVKDNDRRLLPVGVRRDRLRIMYVAGRATYDVRALRTFLKSDRSIDLVGFMILRTALDDVMAPPSELALIPFPVDELFSEHLPSFDAVVLQDIDAEEYGIRVHFPGLRDYVLRGGGLVLVGGPETFGAGGYGEGALSRVIPVAIPTGKKSFDLKPFVPRYTRVGRDAPMLAPLREMLGERLPEMAGANLVGAAVPSAYVLWEHPRLGPAGGSEKGGMPILTLGDFGDGRSVALAVDAIHKLRFGPEGALSGGRAHGAFWEGILGWLMRDPRYETARIYAPWPCISGRPFRIEVQPLPGVTEQVTMQVSELSAAESALGPVREMETRDGALVSFVITGPKPGGYASTVRFSSGPASRFVFACEAGGDAWADSRPDRKALEALSAASGGVSVTPNEIDRLPEPSGTKVITERIESPVLPDAAWAGAACFFLALHWIVRRRDGYL